MLCMVALCQSVLLKKDNNDDDDDDDDDDEHTILHFDAIAEDAQRQDQIYIN